MYCLTADDPTTSAFAAAARALPIHVRIHRNTRASTRHFASPTALEAVASIILLIGGIVQAQTPSTDPIERSIAFVDQSADAVDLYNQGKYADALAIFKSLIQTYPEQDTEGLAVLGMGDSLAALGKIDEARAAYQSAAAQDAKLKDSVDGRLEELELKGSVTDQLIDRLRLQVKQGGETVFISSWRLARALQKQALDRLTEATQAFRDAAGGSGETPCPAAQLLNHAAYLDELVNDLKFFVGEVEDSFKFQMSSKDLDSGSKPSTVERHIQQVIKLPEGRQVEMQVDRDAGDKQAKVKIDGKEVKLTPAQLRLLQRHQDRIDTILLEAGQVSAPQARAGSPK